MTIEFVVKSANPQYSADRNDKNKIDSNKDVQEIFLYKIIDYEALEKASAAMASTTAPQQISSLSSSHKMKKKKILIGSDLQERTFFLDTKNTHYNDKIQRRIEESFQQLHIKDNDIANTISNRNISLLPSSEESKYKQYRLNEIDKSNKDIDKMKIRDAAVDINMYNHYHYYDHYHYHYHHRLQNYQQHHQSLSLSSSLLSLPSSLL